jgi:hypothetical protein
MTRRAVFKREQHEGRPGSCSEPNGRPQRGPGEQTRFERLELKYQINEALVRILRAEIAPYCSPDSHARPELGGSYPIYTLYLDTPRFDFYQQKKRREMDRFKLRVRTYGPESPALLEVKRKCGDVVQKSRAIVPRDIVEDAVRGAGCPTHDTEEQRQNLDRFAFLVARTGAAPVTLIRYLREAWVSRVDGYARVTFDRRLGARMVQGWELGGDDEGDRAREWCSLAGEWLRDGAMDPVLLELKCETRMPEWMAAVIRRHELRKKGFSKYCRGLEVASGWRLGLDAAPGPRGTFV